MNRRALAIASGCALAAAVAAGVIALRPPPGAPMSAPRAAERDVSLPSDWRTELAQAAAGDDGTFREAVRRGLARDPGATLDAVARLEGLAERAKWALSLWLEADPKAARDWAAGLAEAEGRALLAARALGVWARADPAAAWLAAQDLALPGDRAGRRPEPKTIRAAVAQWLSEDFSFGAWKRRRGRLSTAVLDVWAEGGWREPLAAVAATAGAHVPDDWQEAAIARWAESEPLAALEWASSLPRFDAADPGEGSGVARRSARHGVGHHGHPLAAQGERRDGGDRRPVRSGQAAHLQLRRLPGRHRALRRGDGPRAAWRRGSTTSRTRRCVRATPRTWRARTPPRIRRRR